MNIISYEQKPFNKFLLDEQKFIKKFYKTATGSKLEVYSRVEETNALTIKARQMLEQLPTFSSRGQITVQDLLTTSFSNHSNFLLSYCYDSKIRNLNFFDYCWSYIKEVDAIRDAKGQTALVRFASGTTQHERIQKRNDHCLKTLLDKGASYNVLDKNGDDALGIALLSNNSSAITLIKNQSRVNEVPLNPRTKRMLDVYEGANVDVPEFDPAIYRVANQCQNYAMVTKIYDLFLNERMTDILGKLKPSFYFHPPLWAYNITQLKDYVISVAKQLQEHIIDENKLEDVGNDFYNYDNGEKKILLIKKTRNVIGRILGRNYLEKTIRALKAEDEVAVPRKFMTIPSGGIKTTKFTVQIPCQSGYNEVLNKEVVELGIKGATHYAEYIESEPVYFGKAKAVIVASRFIDNNKGNLMRGKLDGKTYFIDTEDQKNFFPKEDYWEYHFDEFKEKSQNFHPRIQFIDIRLSENDFKSAVTN